MAYTFKHGDRPIDGYTIQRAVGRGGFGEVYYALSDAGREVAIKYLRDNPHVELRGVSNCMNLKSPHLVTIFDVRKTVDGEYGILMEYISGPSLRDVLIAEPKGFAPEKAAFFIREIGKGLAYLHDRGIVHRDLKPGNIFYDDGYVKIGDYGLSKAMSVSRHSGQTASVGTVHYMAPEIGSGNYSKGVDIYALGVILYEMLLGKVPFEGSSLAEVLMKHLTARPELDELPDPFGRIIRKALEKDPRDRYQSVDEMIEGLLEVDAVRQSLAGFSTKSLEGAVRVGGPDRYDSPVPSPNPMGRFADAGSAGANDAPFAQPVGQDSPVFSNRLQKRIDRINRKMDAKLAKLARKSPSRATQPAVHYGTPPPPSGTMNPIAAGDRKKRMLLSGLLSVGLAVGLGVLVGANAPEEAGVAAGLLVIAMSGAVILARTAVNWFGVLYGPGWTRHLIQLCCGAPLLAIGASPMLGDGRLSEAGAAVWVGLLALLVFGSWEKSLDKSSGGEMSFGSALWAAFCGFIFTAIAGGFILRRNPDDVMFIAAGVAGASSLILQATAWWLPAKATNAMRHFGPSPYDAGTEPRHLQPPSSADVTIALPRRPGQLDPPHNEHPAPNTGEYFRHDIGYGSPQAAAQAASAAYTATQAAAAHVVHGPARWMATRAFWGLVAFVLMGGAIVTFLIPLISENMAYHDVTAAIIACTGFAAFMIFALRKTTPVKRVGFWRESVRPFLLSAAMFGIGATITGIAREWEHTETFHEHCYDCLGDEGRVALVAGLVMSSLLFLTLGLFTGRRPRPVKPFIQGGSTTAVPELPLNHEEARKASGADHEP
jgi:serine/threonine protein kinase